MLSLEAGRTDDGSGQGEMVREVVIYTKSWCGYCTRARGLLDRKGVPFREIDVTFDPESEREMRQRSGGRTTVPQVFVGEIHVGGSEELAEMERRGGLDELLASESEEEDRGNA